MNKEQEQKKEGEEWGGKGKGEKWVNYWLSQLKDRVIRNEPSCQTPCMYFNLYDLIYTIKSKAYVSCKCENKTWVLGIYI